MPNNRKSGEGYVPGPGGDAEYQKHLLDAAQKASQDFDHWVLTLGTAGITLVTAIAALTDTTSWKFLVASGTLFAASLLAGLVSIRLSADGIRELASGADYDELRQFKAIKVLNWVAALLLTLAYLFLVLHIRDATILEAKRK